jgi:hypothetical protein
MPVFGRSRVPLLPTHRRPTRRCLSGILFDQIVSNPWVSLLQMSLAENRFAGAYARLARIVKIIGKRFARAITCIRARCWRSIQTPASSNGFSNLLRTICTIGIPRKSPSCSTRNSVAKTKTARVGQPQRLLLSAGSHLGNILNGSSTTSPFSIDNLMSILMGKALP